MISRISSAHVLAVVALFVALGGAAYAAHQAAKNSVTSKSIKNGAVQGIDIKDNGLTGKDINESSLAKVPAAAAADTAQTAKSAQTAQSAQTATSATTATTALNVHKIDYSGNQTLTSQSILNVAGMDLQIQCAGPSAAATSVLLTLNSTPGAVANSSVVEAGPSLSADPSERSSESPVVRGAAITPSGSFAVIPPNPSADQLTDNSASPSTFADAEGQIVYRNNTDVVAITFHTFVDHQGSNSGFCELNGVASVS